jgi:Methyltransferase domain
MRANLGVYGVDGMVDVRHHTSVQAAAELADAGRSFDLVFVDGDHTAAGVEHDVTAALRLLRPGGVLAVHDYEECCCPDVGPTLDRLLPDGPNELVDTLAVYQR